MTGTAVKASPEGVPGAVTDPSRVVGEDLTFPGAGATPINGYLARPAGGDPDARRAAVIVIHEAGGLGEHIRDVTNRFANLGYTALGVDLYTREGSASADRRHAGDHGAAVLDPRRAGARRSGGRGGSPARTRGRDRQGRLHRLLHGRALHAAVRGRQ
jgi:dienelactone hydrolase